MNNTELSEIINSLGIGNAPDSWKQHWPESKQNFDSARMPFLNPDSITAVNDMLRLSEGPFQALIAAAEIIRGNQSLMMLAWHWHYLLFHLPDFDEDVRNWPLPEAAMGDLAPMFPAVIAMSGVSHMLVFHRKRGVPEEISRAGLADLELWLQDYKSKHGVWGLAELGWLVIQLHGELYQLGRLQFRPAKNGLHIRVFQNPGDRSILIFSTPDIKYRKDGMMDGTNGRFDPDAWTSYLEIDGRTASGNIITSEGHASQEIVTIHTDEWQEVISPQSRILEVHVPASGKMTHELCLDSYHRAIEFFDEYFPEEKWAAFTIETWLLDSQLPLLLPDDSNIVKFQRDYHIVPDKSGDSQTFERVFGYKSEDISTLPRDNSLRRAILEYIEQGHEMAGMGGFILRDDMSISEKL